MASVGADESELPGFFKLKCSACCSMVAELERNLETEKPRMNVDLRRTLAGGNQGKVVDYAVSELRTLELLEGLCPGMQHYGVTTQDDGTASYQRHNVGGGSVHISGSMTIGSNKYFDDKAKLGTYCDLIVEEHEDLLSEAIRSAGLAHLQRREEENRIAAARRRGEEPMEQTDPRWILGVAADATREEVKAAYRRLSRSLHPDKTGGDPEKMKDFVRVVAAYEQASGEKHAPYEDLYRQVCVEIVGVCQNEAEVDAVKRYFPRYTGSKIFKTLNGVEEEAPKKKQPKKKKKKTKKGAAPSEL